MSQVLLLYPVFYNGLVGEFLRLYFSITQEVVITPSTRERRWREKCQNNITGCIRDKHCMEACLYISINHPKCYSLLNKVEIKAEPSC